LRKKSEDEYERDERDEMSDRDGRQKSMEEALGEVDTKPDESDLKDLSEGEKIDGVKKARATGNVGEGKQLALEESLEEQVTTTGKETGTDGEEKKLRETRGRGKGRQTTLEENLNT